MQNRVVLIALCALAVASTAVCGPLGQPQKKLRLQVIETLPQPVISSRTPGASEIPGGFEGGNTVKLVIDGKPEYHLLAHSYETLDWSHSRIDHWFSEDGLHWMHAGAITRPRTDPATGLWLIDCSPMPFYDTSAKRWTLHYCLYDSREKQWILSNGTMMRAVSKVPGLKGIGGPYDFPGAKLFPRAAKAPNGEFICSISEPYKAKDGRWMMFCTDSAWRVWLASSKNQQGPFTLLGSEWDAPMVATNPPDLKHGERTVAWLENPIPVRLRGPVSKKDYWVATVDFLYDEIKGGANDKIGFSWSSDGIKWPSENGQIVNLRDGLPKGVEPWWHAVRTPHALIDEGHGVYSCYFTATSRSDHGFRGIGLVKFRLKEE